MAVTPTPPQPTGPQGMPDPAAPAPRRRNWWDDLLGNFQLPKFDLGSILGLGVVAALGFFFLRSEWGQKMIHGLIDMLPEGWRNNIGAFLNGIFPGFAPDAANAAAASMTAEEAREKMHGKIPDEIANVIAENDDVWHDFVAQVREAGGDIMEPTSDKVIFQLMTKRPQLVQKILRAARDLPPGTGGDTMKKIQASLLAIVNDPARFNTLLSGENFANTMAALEAACPIPFREGAIAEFVRTTGMQNGQPTDAFRNLLVAVLSDDPGKRGSALLKFMGSAGPDALGKLFQDVDAASIQDANLKTLVLVAQNANNRAALADLGKALDEAQLQQLMGALQNLQQNPRALLTLLKENPDLQAAVTQFANRVDLSTLPESWRAGLTLVRGGPSAIAAADALASSINVERWTSILTNDGQTTKGTDITRNLVDALLDPTMRGELARPGALFHVGELIEGFARNGQRNDPNREGLEFFSVKTRTQDGRPNYINISTLFRFFKEVGGNTNNGGNNTARTRNVVGGFAAFLAGDRAALADLKPAEVCSFFADATNAAAFGRLLNGIDDSTLPTQMRVVIRELKQHWPAIRDLLADPASVEFGLGILSGKRHLPAPDKGPLAGLINPIGEWAAFNLDLSGLGIEGLTPKMREHKDDLQDMLHDLKAAGVTFDTAAAPAPAAPRGPAQRGT